MRAVYSANVGAAAFVPVNLFVDSSSSSAEADSRHRRARARIDRYARILDSGIGIPGTRFRFGLDALIGLIPGVGDVAGLLLGSVLLFEAYTLGVPRPLLWRMIGNVGVDALLGVVPGIGDIFDFVFRSNLRNAQLLRQHLDGRLGAPARPSRSPRKAVTGGLLAVLLGLAALVLLIGWLRHAG